MTERRYSMKEKSLPDGIGGGWGGSKVLALLWVEGMAVSFIPYNLDSLERVLGKDEPREAFGDSVFNIFEL